MPEIMDHTNPRYAARREALGLDKHNGAYYYSKEIVERIIPRVRTDRNWVTVNEPGMCLDHSVVFIHNNLYPHAYNWLACYSDLVLVCGIEETVGKMAGLGKAVHLPLSVDVEYVREFRKPKDRGRAFAGRPEKAVGYGFGEDVDMLSGMPRYVLLSEMARYREVYAVGRTALEAKVLGCEILPYDERFPDPSLWVARDSLWAARRLQELLDGIDKG